MMPKKREKRIFARKVFVNLSKRIDLLSIGIRDSTLALLSEVIVIRIMSTTLPVLGIGCAISIRIIPIGIRKADILQNPMIFLGHWFQNGRLL